MNSFTDVVQEFCPDFNQHCIYFCNFQNSCFTKRLSVTAYDSSATLGNGLCYDVVLHVVETAESKSVKFMEVLDIGCFLIGL